MKITNYRWLIVSLFILACDYSSKWAALEFLHMGRVRPIFPGLNFTLVFNAGTSFNLWLAQSPIEFGILVGIGLSAVFAMLIWLGRLAPAKKGEALALSLILGGAAGNILDRFLYGHVIDFIDMYISHWHWYTYNVADAAISVGALVLLLTARSSKLK